MFSTKSSVLSVSTLLLLGFTTAQRADAQLAIDMFGTDQAMQISGGPTGNKQAHGAVPAAGGDTILGGVRDVLLVRTSSNRGTVDFDVNQSTAGALSYSSGTNTTGYMIATYDGTGDNVLQATGLYHAGVGVDFTTGGTAHGIIGKRLSDDAASLIFTVYTNATHVSQTIVPVPANTVNTYIPFYVDFSAFTSIGSAGGADFTNVGALTMKIDGTQHASTDVSVQLLGTGNATPEPGAIALIMAGSLSGAGFLARRRRATR